jgi:hypothetical protein
LYFYSTQKQKKDIVECRNDHQVVFKQANKKGGDALSYRFAQKDKDSYEGQDHWSNKNHEILRKCELPFFPMYDMTNEQQTLL